jgi:hypothetical protein
MKSLINLACTAVAIVVLALVTAAYAVLPTASVQGPWLGDNFVNLYTLQQAVTYNNQLGFTTAISADQTAGQANCTQLNKNPIQQVTVSAATGYVCLPTALGGQEVTIANATTQTIDVYSSAVSFVSGTPDTINGTTGTTAYAGLTTGKNAQCYSVPGAWYCSSGN